MNEDQRIQLISLCQEKIDEQNRQESNVGNSDNYYDGRIVG